MFHIAMRGIKKAISCFLFLFFQTNIETFTNNCLKSNKWFEMLPQIFINFYIFPNLIRILNIIKSLGIQF